MFKKRKYDENLVASQAETMTSFYGMLAGLTFTASVLIFTFRASLPFGDVFLTLTLVTTICFVYSATLSSDASSALSETRTKDAMEYLNVAENFGVLGFVMMILIEIPFIAFCTGWQYGVVVSIAVILGFFYIAKSIPK